MGSAALRKFELEISADGLRRARQGSGGRQFVVRIEQPVELCTAGPHPPGECRLGRPLFLHQGIELADQHALDGARGYFVMAAVTLEKIVE